MTREEILLTLNELKTYLETHNDEFLIIQNHSTIDDELLDEEIDYELTLNTINNLLNIL